MWSLALSLALMSNEPPPQAAAPEPPRGHVAVGLGIAGIAFTANPGSPKVDATAQRPPLGSILLGTGFATAGLGAIGIIVGCHLNGKWKAWAARHPDRASRLQLAPSGWAGRESFGFVIGGRF